VLLPGYVVDLGQTHSCLEHSMLQTFLQQFLVLEQILSEDRSKRVSRVSQIWLSIRYCVNLVESDSSVLVPGLSTCTALGRVLLDACEVLCESRSEELAIL
jgi:hypothetical protein